MDCMTEPARAQPPTIEILIEVPRGRFVKRDGQGRLEFLSPLPCPCNYSSVPALAAPDGDALDAVLLGPRRTAGQRLSVAAQAVVRFVDAGLQDDKLICADAPLSAAEQAQVLGFFRFYALCKRFMNLARGRRGQTRCLGWGDTALTLGPPRSSLRAKPVLHFRSCRAASADLTSPNSR